MSYFSSLTNRVEIPLKLVVTSQEPNALTAELGKWPTLDLDAYLTDTTCEIRTLAADSIEFCPSDAWRRDIQGYLDRLSPMGQSNLHMILGILFDHTNWPDNPSGHSLSKFTHLLSLVSPSDTPEKVLDRIIRSDKHADRLCWVLTWLQCSYRPLTLNELAAVVEYYHKPNTSRAETSEQPLFTLQQLKTWIRMFTNFKGDQATIRPHILKLLGNKEDNSYIWNEVENEAHQNLAEFCLAFLTAEKAVRPLRDIVLTYESALKEQQEQIKIATLVLPRDEGILLYAVEALPYHLSKWLSSHSTKALSFFLDESSATVSTLWAKAYWAMRSPLSRNPAPPESALPLCVSLGLLSHEKLNTETESLQVQCMSSSIISGLGSGVLSFFPLRPLAVATSMELLLSALQANDQTTALDLAVSVLSHPEWHTQIQTWPHFAIWTAVWLNMVELTNLLLDNGVSVDSGPSAEPMVGYYPSILYLSSVLNHHAIVNILLARGASSKAPSPSSYGSFQAAAYRGHVEVVQKYLDYDDSHKEDGQPYSALYSASEWGAWESVRTLIDAGAAVNEPQGETHTWMPLAIACNHGYTKTVEALLVGGANVNAVGPYGVDTALWFPAYSLLNVECVRVMLKHNADPNHQHFNPPLLIEMANSNHDTTRLLPICEALLNVIRPIDINAVNGDGQTALMIASMSGKLGLVNWLLTSGAEIDALNRVNKSALYYSISSGHVDVVAALLENGAQIDKAHTSNKGHLLLMAESNPQIVRHLLDYGADANLANWVGVGNTAINSASASGSVEVAEILIEKGADINHRDYYGWAPIFDAV
jgi:ankyrin repeat protein